MRRLILLLIVVRYSCQSVTYTAVNITEINVTLEKLVRCFCILNNVIQMINNTLI